MHRETRIVPYPAELMYRVVAEVENYPQFLPWCVGLRIKLRTEQAIIAEMLVGYGNFREKYTSRIDLDPAQLRIDVAQTDGPFRKLENHWRFTPMENDCCEIDFTIDFAFKNRVLGAVAGAAFEKVLLTMTQAFEARAKALQEKTASHE